MQDDFNRSRITRPVLDQQTLDRIETDSKQSFLAANKWYILAIALALAVIGVLAYLVFFTSAGTGQDAAVKVTIEAPESAPTNSEVVYRIRIENQDNRRIQAGELELVYPEGATYVTSTPPRKSDSGALFPVPGLISGQNAVIFVKLKLNGSIGQNQEMTARYRYAMAGISTRFESMATNSLALAAAGLKLSFNGPVNTNMNQLVVYNLTYQNDSTETVRQARVKMSLPNNFSVENTTPPKTGIDFVWNIGDLAPNQTGKITITGSYKSGVSGETKIIEAVLELLSQDGTYITQANTSFNTALNSSPLSMNVQYEGDSAAVKPGQRLTFSINFVNNGSVVSHGVNLEAVLDGKAFDLASITAKGAIINGSTITWNASSLPELENLGANQSGTTRFSVAVKNPPTKDNSKNLELKVASRIYSQSSSVSFPGPTTTVKIATQPRVDIEGQHVSGPLPLRVGETTEYKIKLILYNTTNDLSDTVVTAFIPLDAGSFDTASLPSRDSSQVRFDPQTGKLTWNAGVIPAYTGSFSQARTLEFRLKVKPQSSQSGRSILLVKNIIATGRDVFTGENITFTAEDINTGTITSNGIVQQ